jgi:hypothetical protein
MCGIVAVISKEGPEDGNIIIGWASIIPEQRQNCIHPLIIRPALMMKKRPEEELFGCIICPLPAIEGKNPVKPVLAVGKDWPEKCIGGILIIHIGLGIEREQDKARMGIPESVLHRAVEREYPPIGGIFIPPIKNREEHCVLLILLIRMSIHRKEKITLLCEVTKGIKYIHFAGIFILEIEWSHSTCMWREFKDWADAAEYVLIAL